MTISSGTYLGLDEGLHNYVAEASGYQSKSGTINLVYTGPDAEPTELYVKFKTTNVATPSSNLFIVGILAVFLVLLLSYTKGAK